MEAVDNARAGRTQTYIGILVLVLLLFWSGYLQSEEEVLAIQLFSGVLLGFVLARARFGFAGGIKRIYVRGEGSLTKALLVMLAVTLLLFFGVQWFAAQNGALPAFRALEGQPIIPGTQNVYFTNLATIVGGILFGIGMIFAGGCASGTLTDMGEGEGRSMLVFIFFVLGSAPGEWARYIFDQSRFGKAGVQIYLPDYLGYFGSLILSLFFLLLIYWGVLMYENKRKKEKTYLDPYGDWETFEQPLKNDHESEVSFFSHKIYHKFFIERLSFTKGAILVAIICTFILLTTHKAWGVTGAFSLLNVTILQKFGVSFDSPAFSDLVTKADGGILTDGVTIRNIGIVLGATLAFLFARRFSFNFKFSVKDSIYFVVGGLLMGFGARLAKGCNAGAMYSAISTFSISGWVFAIAMAVGGIIALKVFAGKMSLIPASHKK